MKLRATSAGGIGLAALLLVGACSSAPGFAPASTLTAQSATNAVPRVAASADTPPASILAASCTGCHAATPVRGAIPVLAGRRAETLKKQMRAYRDGTRKGTLMPRLLAGYSDEQIIKLANYFANQSSATAN